MPLTIDDDEVAGLVDTLARRRGVSGAEAVRLAVRAALDRDAAPEPLRDVLHRLWRDNPLPPPTGLVADKAFFDELSGEP